MVSVSTALAKNCALVTPGYGVRIV